MSSKFLSLHLLQLSERFVQCRLQADCHEFSGVNIAMRFGADIFSSHCQNCWGVCGRTHFVVKPLGTSVGVTRVGVGIHYVVILVSLVPLH